ncbi:(deoxy)nucleoside triphosphate pyrophosphohydrolase [bacterium]|jgi:8-oxo-dGTP diphosphatase|nr:(deoxy)nucleoside triphosphate pyrophosphohydrolase [bacterium]
MRVVCAVILYQGRVLACQRAVGKPEGGKWEFPGGKVEEGESDQVALAREIEEELAMSVSLGSVVKSVSHGEIELWAYRSCWDGVEMELREHRDAKWIIPAEGDMLDWAPADVAIWKEVRRTCFPRV